MELHDMEQEFQVIGFIGKYIGPVLSPKTYSDPESGAEVNYGDVELSNAQTPKIKDSFLKLLDAEHRKGQLLNIGADGSDDGGASLLAKDELNVIKQFPKALRLEYAPQLRSIKHFLKQVKKGAINGNQKIAQDAPATTRTDNAKYDMDGSSATAVIQGQEVTSTTAGKINIKPYQRDGVMISAFGIALFAYFENPKLNGIKDITEFCADHGGDLCRHKTDFGEVLKESNEIKDSLASVNDYLMGINQIRNSTNKRLRQFRLLVSFYSETQKVVPSTLEKLIKDAETLKRRR